MKWATMVLDNALLSVLHQNIIWTNNAALLLTSPLGTNTSEIWIMLNYNKTIMDT